MLQPADIIRAEAPSRLHFGLLSFGSRAERQFGGVGMMIDHPTVKLTVQPADGFDASGPLCERAAEFARRWSDFHRLDELPACRIVVDDAPPQHVGLGVGTQLALSVAAALNAIHRRPCPPPAQLALSVGRGLRSAVGTYGFYEGGLIVERGKRADETLSPLDSRLDIPIDWRIVLVRPRDFAGLAGDAEQCAFDQLPSVSPTVTESLARELREHLLPALARADFAGFSESLYRYGRDAGLCFKAIQGGPYNGPQLSALVEQIRALGVVGVGQSSWGPTIYAVFEDEISATTFLGELRTMLAPSKDKFDFVLARPNNVGARVSRSA